MAKQIIIVDDADYKRNRIKEYVKSIVEDVTFIEFDCAREFLVWLKPYFFGNNELKEELLNNAMLFLDWNFPFYKNDRVEIGEGRSILFNLDRRDFPLKTVVVSSENVEESERDYPFVLGFIKDDMIVYQKDEYEELLKEAGLC